MSSYPYALCIRMSSVLICHRHPYVIRMSSAYVSPHMYVIRIRMWSVYVCHTHHHVLRKSYVCVRHQLSSASVGYPHRNVHRYVPIRNTVLAHRFWLDHWSWATSRPVQNWMGDRLGLPGAVYTKTCVQRCRVVGLREPRESDGSSDWTSELNPRKSTIWSTWQIRLWLITGLAKLLPWRDSTIVCTAT